MGIWKAFISVPIVWIAETVGVIETLGIEGWLADIGYIGILIGLIIIGLLSNEGSK